MIRIDTTRTIGDTERDLVKDFAGHWCASRLASTVVGRCRRTVCLTNPDRSTKKGAAKTTEVPDELEPDTLLFHPWTEPATHHHCVKSHSGLNQTSGLADVWWICGPKRVLRPILRGDWQGTCALTSLIIPLTIVDVTAEQLLGSVSRGPETFHPMGDIDVVLHGRRM
ncbi:uncharacterized protein LOC127918308 isoform X2 [Oncorhynchus keta]|uniref:uncharacterized protein LOC127918308 isoform X2 n=1 Tax=Oncorhynchus keta TaxID=8018 RepID=UPI00227ADCAC|nr:uncharacterized protein LOC127918308 isoform X2 [Oncorhynchus keta]